MSMPAVTVAPSRMQVFRSSALRALQARLQFSLSGGLMEEARLLLARFEEKRGHQDSLGALLQLLTLVDQPCPRQLDIMVSRVTLFVAADGRVTDGQRVQLMNQLQRVREAGAVSLPAMQSLLRVSRQLPV